jgi:hypothetical protein
MRSSATDTEVVVGPAGTVIRRAPTGSTTASASMSTMPLGREAVLGNRNGEVVPLPRDGGALVLDELVMVADSGSS